MRMPLSVEFAPRALEPLVPDLTEYKQSDTWNKNGARGALTFGRLMVTPSSLNRALVE